jgi:hypothetical protein
MWARRPTVVSVVDVAYVLSLCVIALPYIRTMPILAIGLAPIAAAAVSPRGDHPGNRGISVKGLAARTALVGMTLAGAAVWTAQVPSMGSGAPFAASEALDRLPGRARVLNEYVLGGWLLWTARDSSPALDGRTEIFEPAYLERALGALAAESHWKSFVTRHHIDAAWVDQESSLAREMRRAGWTVYFKDTDSFILTPPGT